MSSQGSVQGLTIGRAADAAGLTRKAVRLYEAKGLLPPVGRGPAGYRVYDQADVELLIFVGRARALGLHLHDIRRVLTIRHRGAQPCAAVRALLDAHVTEIDDKIAELRALRETLLDTRRAGDTVAEGSVRGPATVCPIIEATSARTARQPGDHPRAGQE